MLTDVRTSDTGSGGELAGAGWLAPGAMAGPWRIERELGRGGMGTVYAVTHQDIGKRAALKVVHAHVLTPSFTAARFLLEASIVNQVAHPGVVDIFETGVLPDGRPFLVMEHLEGMTLGERLVAGRILADEICAILLQVCEPIRAAHAAGVVHRDLKLDNVFLISGAPPAAPVVKVLDWGIAKILGGGPASTLADGIVGTPRYLPPEQVRGEVITTRSDVYSLGVMAYELFLEEPPFVADSVAELLVMHLHEAPLAPHELWPGIPPPLERLLLEMLSKEASSRPTLDAVVACLRGMRDRLRAVASAPGLVSLPITPPTRPTSRPARMARGLALVAVLGAVAASARVWVRDTVADPAPPGAAPGLSCAPGREMLPRGGLRAPAPTLASSMGASAPSEPAPPATVHDRALPRAPRAPARRTTRHHVAARARAVAPVPVGSGHHARFGHHVAAARRVAAVLDPDGSIAPYR